MKCNFTDSIRFSVPSNGGWNLAHICRLIPESHALFATPAGCSRIIMLSALEKGMAGQFSSLSISSGDLIDGDVESKIVDGASAVLSALKDEGRAPKVFMVFTSCVDGFIGTDHDVYMNALTKKYPEIRFLDLRMDPINREDGVPPIVRMHSGIASLFERTHAEKAVNVLGSFLPPGRGQELAEHLISNGFAVKHAYSCGSFAELADMGNSALNIVVHPSALPAAKELCERLSQPYISLVAGDPFADMPEKYSELCRTLGISELPTEKIAKATSAELESAAVRLAAHSIVMDDGAASRPFSLAKVLSRHGFNVKRLFCDDCPPAEAAALAELPESIDIIQGNSPDMRSAYAERRYFDENALAIGEVAAYLTGTRHFITPFVFDGSFGYSLLTDIARELENAAKHERPITDILETARGCMAI